MRSAQHPAEAGLCGVGIAFQIPTGNRHVIRGLVPGGPAQRGATLQVGDVLHRVDGKHVADLTSGQIAALVLGEEGSEVRWTAAPHGSTGHAVV
jgi:C-terminal processing protease CtpA/Prc